MARKLGWGGLGNTNGARDFSSKVTAPVTTAKKVPSISTVPTEPKVA